MSLESFGKPDAVKAACPVWGWGRGEIPRPTPHVELSNVTSQGYLADDVGRPKVEATGDLCHRLEHQLDLEMIADRFRPAHKIAPYVFCAVDSISARAAIWRAVQHRCVFFADARMSGESLRVLAVHEQVGREHFPTTLFPQAEAHAGSCTSRSTIYAASLAAALVVHQFTRALRGLPPDVDATFNLLAGEYVVAPVSSG
jgi:hypothetical protein